MYVAHADIQPRTSNQTQNSGPEHWNAVHLGSHGTCKDLRKRNQLMAQGNILPVICTLQQQQRAARTHHANADNTAPEADA